MAPSLLALLVVGAAACHLISGIGNLDFVDGTSAAGGSGGTIVTTPSGAPTSSSSTAGGGGQSATGGSTSIGGAGGVGGGTGGTACLLGPADGFTGTGINTSEWAITYEANADYGIANGRFYIEPWPNYSGAWIDLSSVGSYDLTECAALVQLVAALDQTDGISATALQIWPSSWNDSAGIVVAGNRIGARLVTASSEQTLGELDYLVTDHRWLRLRGAASELHFEVSKDAKIWSNIATTAAPAWLDSVHVVLNGGTWDAGMAAPGRAEFDRVNLPPP